MGAGHLQARNLIQLQPCMILRLWSLKELCSSTVLKITHQPIRRRPDSDRSTIHLVPLAWAPRVYQHVTGERACDSQQMCRTAEV
jgi:hypothetical protein